MEFGTFKEAVAQSPSNVPRNLCKPFVVSGSKKISGPGSFEITFISLSPETQHKTGNSELSTVNC